MNILEKAAKSFLGGSANIMAFPWDIPGRWNRRKQLEQFNGYIHSIVSKFAADFARVELRMAQKTGKKYEELDDHVLLGILDAPNALQTGFQFRELHAIYMKLAGESFWYVVRNGLGKPEEMYLIRPDLMEVEIADDAVGSIKGYVLQKEGGEKQHFTPDEIIHHKLPNPINPYRGLGVIEAAMTYIQTEAYASDWTKNSIYNSGRPSGILHLKGKLNDDQYNQLKRSFKQEYTGTKNTGKTLLVKGFDGIDWVKLGMDLEGIDLEKVKKLTREDLMFMFRVSNTIMGISDDVNRANSKELRGVWMENEIKPEMDRLVDILQARLVPAYGERYKITYADPNPETIEDRLGDWTAGHNKWLTTNQIISERNRILGEDAALVVGGDSIYQPYSMVPIQETRREEPEEEPGEESEEEEKACACGNHTKQAVPLEDTPALSRRQRGEILRKGLYEEQMLWETPFRKIVNQVFESQRKEVLAKMDSSKGVEKDIISWVFDKVLSLSLWKELLTPLALEIVSRQSSHLFEFVDDGSVQGILEITPEIRRMIEQRIERFAAGVDESTIEDLTEEISEGIKLGESISKIRNRINQTFNSATSMRSERIARTETIFISNEASQLAMEQLPTVTAKEWMVNPDACEFCQALDGSVVGLSEDFFLRGESMEGTLGGVQVVDYEDIRHPPLHPNCLVADTLIATQTISKHFKRWFDGEIVTISVPGNDIRITPNHPVLTDKGWVPAGDIKIGDNIYQVRGWEDFVSNPDDNYRVAPIEKIVDSFEMSGDVSFMSVPVSRKDFHGDGVVDTEVDIVNMDSFFSSDILESAREAFVNGKLCWTHFRRILLSAISSLNLLGDAVLTTSYSFVGVGNSSLSLSFGNPTGLDDVSLANTSGSKTHPLKSPQKALMGVVDSPDNIIKRFSSKISLVKVINVLRSEFHGFVYNIENNDGYYLSNSILTHNCRCTILPVQNIKIHKSGNTDRFEEERQAVKREMEEVEKEMDMVKQEKQSVTERVEKLESLLEKYEDMDKRTREAKSVLEEITEATQTIDKSKKEFSDTLEKIEQLLN